MKYLATLLFSILLMQNAFAFPVLNPGPDGVRFDKNFILLTEKKISGQLSNKSKSAAELAELTELSTILKIGKRAIAWFEYINSFRSPENKLDLTVKGSSKGMPLDAPMKTNTTILTDRYNKIIKEASPLLLTILINENEVFPTNVPVSDEEFVKTIRLFDVVYQHTIRWSNAKDYLSWYINRSLWDIRGFVFLGATADLQNKLTNWSHLTDAEKTNFQTWLFSLCHNGDFEDSDCKSELGNAINKGRAFSFYQRFNKYGDEMYKSFFKLQAIRPEVYWNSDKTILYSPFLAPERLDVKNWLSENIQEEWKNTGFNLVLEFKETSIDKIPHIEFKSGVTAHVNEIAGDTITMDGDYSISSYAQKWTIRHEYGHILGFVDCYLEFYDVNEKAMIYYEVDTDNLMCSRHGKLSDQHVTQLRNAYKK